MILKILIECGIICIIQIFRSFIMKKIIAFILMLTMLLGLASCATGPIKSKDEVILLFDTMSSVDDYDDNDDDYKDDDEDYVDEDEDYVVDDKEDKKDKDKDDKKDKDDEDEDSKSQSVEVELKDEDDEEPEEEPKDDSTDLIPGTTVGNVFESEYSGLKFTKPSDWLFYSLDELYELMDIGADALDLELSEYQKEIAKLTLVYDMMAVSTAGDNVQIMYENLVPTLSTKITEQQYLKNVASGLETMGYTVGQTHSTKLSGATYYYFEATNTINGREITQVYYARKTGNYMNGVISTLVTKDREDIEQMFS